MGNLKKERKTEKDVEISGKKKKNEKDIGTPGKKEKKERKKGCENRWKEIKKERFGKP